MPDSSQVTTRKQIPDALYYVLCNDPFLSNWEHMDTYGKVYTSIAPCESREEAETFKENALARKDQKNVRICIRKPVLRPGHYYVLMSKETSPKWYRKGAARWRNMK